MPDELPENSDPTGLSPQQLRVVVALAQGQTYSAAAKAAGVHRTTVYNWMKDPAFDAAIVQARDDYLEALNHDFKTLTGLVLTRFRMLLESPHTPPGVVFQIGRAILGRSPLYLHVFDSEASQDSDPDEDDAATGDSTPPSESVEFCRNLSNDQN